MDYLWSQSIQKNSAELHPVVESQHREIELQGSMTVWKHFGNSIKVTRNKRSEHNAKGFAGLSLTLLRSPYTTFSLQEKICHHMRSRIPGQVPYDSWSHIACLQLQKCQVTRAFLPISLYCKENQKQIYHGYCSCKLKHRGVIISP